VAERLRQIRWTIRSTGVGRVILSAVLIVGALFGAATSAGAEPLADERPVKIAVAPTSFQVFGPPGDEGFDYSVAGASRTGVSRYLGNHPEVFEVVTAREVRTILRNRPLYDETLADADQWTKYGTDNYKRLEVEKAIDQLENAVERYDKVHYEQVDPERMAEILMYVALSYLNKGDAAKRPLEAMKRMVRLDPSRLLREGFYPNRIAEFYQTARRDVVRRLRERGPRPARAERLIEWTDAELAVFGGTFRGEGGEYRSKLYVYSRSEGGFLEPESTAVGAPTASNLRAASNRLMARFAPGVYEPAAESAETTLLGAPGKSPISTHLSFVYASFLEFPDAIEKPFGNAGVGIGTHLAVTDEFGVGIELNLLSSFRDFSGRVLDNFSTIRTFAGPDLGVGIGRLNLGLSARLEVAHVGDFRVCQQRRRPPQRGCRPTARRTYPNLNVLAGVNTQPRARLELVEPFELFAAGSFTTYLLPASRPLNNPLSGKIGIRYRF